MWQWSLFASWCCMACEPVRAQLLDGLDQDAYHGTISYSGHTYRQSNAPPKFGLKVEQQFFSRKKRRCNSRWQNCCGVPFSCHSSQNAWGCNAWPAQTTGKRRQMDDAEASPCGPASAMSGMVKLSPNKATRHCWGKTEIKLMREPHSQTQTFFVQAGPVPHTFDLKDSRTCILQSIAILQPCQDALCMLFCSCRIELQVLELSHVVPLMWPKHLIEVEVKFILLRVWQTGKPARATSRE